MPKRGDEDPNRPGWRWHGSKWLSPETWVRDCLRTAGQHMAEREWKRLYYVPKCVPKGPPYFGDEHPDKSGWRRYGSKWLSPETWARSCLRVAGAAMARREYDRIHGKQWDTTYGKHMVKDTPERKAYTQQHTKAKQAMATALLEKQQHRCAYCGCSIGYDLEHISTPSFDRIDTTEGPYYTEDTTQALCHSCNGMKGQIEEAKLLKMTNVSSLVKHNIRRYLDGAPRIFEDKPDDDTCVRHRSRRSTTGADDDMATDDSGGGFQWDLDL